MALGQAGTPSLLGATYPFTVTTSLCQGHGSLVLRDLQGLWRQDPTPRPPKHLTHIKSLKICDTEQDPTPAPGLQTRDRSPGRLWAVCAHPFGPEAWRRAAQGLSFGRAHRLGGVLGRVQRGGPVQGNGGSAGPRDQAARRYGCVAPGTPQGPDFSWEADRRAGPSTALRFSSWVSVSTSRSWVSGPLGLWKGDGKEQERKKYHRMLILHQRGRSEGWSGECPETGRCG